MPSRVLLGRLCGPKALPLTSHSVPVCPPSAQLGTDHSQCPPAPGQHLLAWVKDTRCLGARQLVGEARGSILQAGTTVCVLF